MKLDPKKFLLCTLGDGGRLVAIDGPNQKVLAHHIGISGELEKVPADKTVRGLFVTISPEGFLESIDDTLQQQDITINQLIMPAL